MTKPIAVDVHAHYFPERFFSIIEEAGQPFGARIDRSHATGPVIELKGSRTFPLEVTYWDLDRRVKANLRRFTYDTITHSPRLLKFLIDTVGAERVMLGSDYCFDMGYKQPVDVVTRQLRLDRADQRRILGATAARLLKLG